MDSPRCYKVKHIKLETNWNKNCLRLNFICQDQQHYRNNFPQPKIYSCSRLIRQHDKYSEKSQVQLLVLAISLSHKYMSWCQWGQYDTALRPINHCTVHRAGCWVWSTGDNCWLTVDDTWPCSLSLPGVLSMTFSLALSPDIHLTLGRFPDFRESCQIPRYFHVSQMSDHAENKPEFTRTVFHPLLTLA